MYYINYLDKGFQDKKKYLSVGATSFSFYEYRDLLYLSFSSEVSMNAFLPPNTIFFDLQSSFFSVNDITYKNKKEIDKKEDDHYYSENFRVFKYDVEVPVKLSQQNPLLGEIGSKLDFVTNINFHFNRQNLINYNFQDTTQESLDNFILAVESNKLLFYSEHQNKFYVTPDSGKVSLKSCYFHKGYIIMRKEEIDPERPKKILMSFSACDNIDLIKGTITINYTLPNQPIAKTLTIPLEKIYKDSKGNNYILFDKKYYLDNKSNEVKGVFINEPGYLFIDTDCHLDIKIKLKIKISEHFRYLEFSDKINFTKSNSQNLKNKFSIKSVDNKNIDISSYQKVCSY